MQGDDDHDDEEFENVPFDQGVVSASLLIRAENIDPEAINLWTDKIIIYLGYARISNENRKKLSNFIVAYKTHRDNNGYNLFSESIAGQISSESRISELDTIFMDISHRLTEKKNNNLDDPEMVREIEIFFRRVNNYLEGFGNQSLEGSISPIRDNMISSDSLRIGNSNGSQTGQVGTIYDPSSVRGQSNPFISEDLESTTTPGRSQEVKEFIQDPPEHNTSNDTNSFIFRNNENSIQDVPDGRPDISNNRSDERQEEAVNTESDTKMLDDAADKTARDLLLNVCSEMVEGSQNSVREEPEIDKSREDVMVIDKTPLPAPNPYLDTFQDSNSNRKNIIPGVVRNRSQEIESDDIEELAVHIGDEWESFEEQEKKIKDIESQRDLLDKKYKDEYAKRAKAECEETKARKQLDKVLGENKILAQEVKILKEKEKLFESQKIVAQKMNDDQESIGLLNKLKEKDSIIEGLEIKVKSNKQTIENYNHTQLSTKPKETLKFPN